MDKWCFLRNSNNRRTVKSILRVKKFLGLVEMTSGLVNASFSFPKWQAVKMIFFAPCYTLKMAWYWPPSFFAVLLTSISSWSIKAQKWNLANIQYSTSCLVNNTLLFTKAIIHSPISLHKGSFSLTSYHEKQTIIPWMPYAQGNEQLHYSSLFQIGCQHQSKDQPTVV